MDIFDDFDETIQPEELIFNEDNPIDTDFEPFDNFGEGDDFNDGENW